MSYKDYVMDLLKKGLPISFSSHTVSLRILDCVWSVNNWTGRPLSGSGNSDVEGQAKEWKSIWSIISPNKMEIVLWRMAHDCLPTGPAATPYFGEG